MKLSVTLTVMLTIILAPIQLKGQSVQFTRNNQLQQKATDIGFTVSSIQKVGKDTIHRVLAFYVDSTLTYKYKVQFILDSVKNIENIELLDSIIYVRPLVPDSENAISSHRKRTNWTLINSDNILANNPVEDEISYNGSYDKECKRKISFFEKSKFVIDSLGSAQKFKLNGSIRLDGQLSNGNRINQAIPHNYLRSYVDLDVKIGYLPFSASYLYTTESNSGLNQINNYRISFDYEQFYNNIKNKVDTRLKEDKVKQINRSVSIDIISVKKELVALESTISDKVFLEQLTKWNKVLELGELDSNYKNTYRYKRAERKMNDYYSKTSRVSELKNLILQYNRYEQIANIDENIQRYKLSRPKDLRRAASKFGYLNSTQALFLSIKKLDFGTFDPDYTKLILSGVGVTGINAEINHGYLYGAFTWGKTVISNVNFTGFGNLFNEGRTIVSGRVGVGNKSKYLLAVSMLNGRENAQLSMDTLFIGGNPFSNKVLGFDFTYRINESSETGFEYARSDSRMVNSEAIVIRNLASENKYSNALRYFIKTSINQDRTRIVFSLSAVDPNYISFGSPYLRRDNLRLESKLEQYFWMKQFSFSMAHRRDQDNIRATKQGTSTNNAFVFSCQLRIKKRPYLILTYSPNYQKFYVPNLKEAFQSNVNIINLVSGYVYQTRAIVSNTVFSFTKLKNNSNQELLKSIHTNQYSLTENINFKKANLLLTTSIIYVLPISTFNASKSSTLMVNLSKGINHNRLNINSGYRYQRDYLIETRHIGDFGTSFNAGFGIAIQIHIEYHFINKAQELASNNMSLGRLTIFKSF